MVFVVAVSLVACTSATPTASSNAPASSAVNTGTITKVNLNTANGDDFLAAIPGLGDRMVREFQEYRPYISIQQFRREIGKYVDDAQVAEYEKYVYVPIAINDSDSETL
jgi:DNA uptake protein ComE-like DNA-binding protein